MAQALPELIHRKGFVPQPVFTNMKRLKLTAKNDPTTARCDENNDCIITVLEQVSECLNREFSSFSYDSENEDELPVDAVSECLNSEFSFSYDSENEDELQADAVDTDDDMPNAPSNTPR